ncbi:porin family protein [Hymenobacter arizonensis]|uniref:Outer membrane protein beta-barrel domain-containing protein n=1 Tax=Hymenobacter arizonensis TaxID=1227077 RepID=A0A1I5STF1_HYMAR|nr:porin family protein [Hymenobacter arizonensis]SFP74019.1 Outer membrane protein beta-barrel domain-containing protein [Hymenobacter arizonensis]
MKKAVFIFLLTVCFVPLANAQLGVKGGLNLAELTGRDGESSSYKAFYHVGLFYEAKVLGPLAIQPEVQYSVAGGRLKSAFTNYDSQLHYLTVPVLAKLTVGPVFVEAGPQFGVLLSADQSGQMQVGLAPDGTPAYGNESRPATGNFKRGDFSVVGGVGLKLAGGFSLGSRLVAGLNDINDVKNLSGINDPRLQNRVFQFYAALQFGGR